MRIYFSRFCKCFGLFGEEGHEEGSEAKEDISSISLKQTKENQTEGVFRVKEVRQRSVDYVVHSPRFGNGLQDCTGGTDNCHIKAKT
jgi:hypothetical protein